VLALMMASMLSCGASDPRPDLVVIVLDTLRRDAMDAETTPNLDALARRGARYAQAWSVAPWTVPSHASMFTGLLPGEHGANSRSPRLPAELTTIAEVLRDDGYETAAFYSNPWLSDRATGLLRGFETRTPAPIGNPSTLRSARGDQGGAETVENVRRWLVARRDDPRPFLLFVNFLEAHLPYDPPTAIREEQLADVPSGEVRSIAWGHGVNAGAVAPDAVDWEVTRRLYRADARAADALLGQLVALLEEQGNLDDTILIVTSDHGENLGEHGLAEHQFSVHETLLAVPLVVVAPGPLLPPGVRNDPVMLVDLFPTLAALAGTSVAAPPLHARSLLETDPPDRALLAEYAPPSTPLLRVLRRQNPALDLTPFERGFRSIRIGNERLTIASDGSVQLHDLAADALQRTDLAPTAPKRVERLRARLDALEVLSSRAAQEPGTAPAPMDPETRERLRSLGYVE